MNYFINTFSTRMFMMALDKGKLPSLDLILQFDMVKVSKFEYYLFKYLRINTRAKDKLQWAKVFFREWYKRFLANRKKVK